MCKTFSKACATHGDVRFEFRSPFRLVMLQIKQKEPLVGSVIENFLRVCPGRRWTMHQAHQCLEPEPKDWIEYLASNEILD